MAAKDPGRRERFVIPLRRARRQHRPSRKPLSTQCCPSSTACRTARKPRKGLGAMMKTIRRCRAAGPRCCSRGRPAPQAPAIHPGWRPPACPSPRHFSNNKPLVVGMNIEQRRHRRSDNRCNMSAGRRATRSTWRCAISAAAGLINHHDRLFPAIPPRQAGRMEKRITAATGCGNDRLGLTPRAKRPDQASTLKPNG